MKKLLRNNIFWILCILLLFFLLSTIVYVNFHKIKTEIVVEGCIVECVEGPCFAVRNEVLIEIPDNGKVFFNLKDGEKISSGCEIAKFYKTNDDYKNMSEIEKIDQEIESLEELNNRYNKIAGNFNNLISEYNLKIKQNLLYKDYTSIVKNHEDLKRTVIFFNNILSSPGTFTNTINNLKQKKETIQKSLGTENQRKILSSYSGYFSAFSDGFENSLDINAIYSIKPKDVDNLLSINSPKINNKSKIVKSAYWYLILKIPNSKVKNIQINDNVTLLSISESFENIPAKVFAINSDENNEFSSLVLRSDYITKEILKLRKEKVRVRLKSYEGLKFGKKALIEKISPRIVKDDSTGTEIIVNKPVFGVNVLTHGTSKKVVFKEVEPIYSNEKYVICKNKENSNNKLNIYDEIIVE